MMLAVPNREMVECSEFDSRSNGTKRQGPHEDHTYNMAHSQTAEAEKVIENVEKPQIKIRTCSSNVLRETRRAVSLLLPKRSAVKRPASPAQPARAWRSILLPAARTSASRSILKSAIQSPAADRARAAAGARLPHCRPVVCDGRPLPQDRIILPRDQPPKPSPLSDQPSTRNQSSQTDNRDTLLQRVELQKTKRKLWRLQKLFMALKKENKVLKDSMKFLKPDQLNALCKKKAHKWSKDSLWTAYQLCFSGGRKNYEFLLKQGFPLPSYRTLCRRLEHIVVKPGAAPEFMECVEDSAPGSVLDQKEGEIM